MIPGFKDETKPLTRLERDVYLPRIIDGFAKLPELYVISSSKIIEKLGREGIKISAARVRKLINHIRNNHLVRNICANSKGYWIETRPDELKKYVEAAIKRSNSIYAMALSLEEDYKLMSKQFKMYVA